MEKKLKLAIEAAVEAGREIMKIYEKDDFDIEQKSDNSPLTEADTKANTIINSYLQSTEIPIISEENRQLDYEKRKDWKQCWIVDPLDGTKEFIKRNGEFTVNIALIEDSFPKLGVIYVPANNTLFYANVEDKEAFKLKIENVSFQNIHFDNAKKLISSNFEGKIRVVGSRSHMNKDTEEYISNLKDKFGKEIKVVSRGSSLKFCLVAEGEADVYPRFAPTMEWDTAAGHAICKAVGLTVVDSKTNKEMRYNRPDLLNNHFLVSNFG